MDQYKVTVLGSRKVGKTALVHYMTNMSSFGNQYNPTKNLELRHIKLDHPDEAVGQCSIALEDTPGFKPSDSDFSELLEPKICYVWCPDGVRKPGAEDPDAPAEEGAEKHDEKTPLVENELTGVSPIDSKLDRQGFVIVYNPLEKESFTAAERLVTELVAKMAKPEPPEGEEEAEQEAEDEDPPELPPYPFVVVATHADLKKAKKLPKNIVTAEQGSELAQSVGAPFFTVNANGKNVRKVLEAVVTGIHNVEANLVFDKELTECEKWQKQFGCSVM